MEKLQEIYKEYYNLLMQGVNRCDASKTVSEQTSGGYTINKYDEIEILHNGDYLLDLSTGKVYKKCE